MIGLPMYFAIATTVFSVVTVTITVVVLVRAWMK